MKKKFTFLIAAMALILAIMGPHEVAWGQTTQTWSYEVIQDSPTLFTGSPATVNDATWSIVMGEVVGSPTTNGVPTKYSSIFGWKWGDSSSKYYKSYTLSTDYFTDKNVKRVTVNFLNNGNKTGTMTVTQGSTTIGTASAVFGQTWTNLTANTTTGSGGTLSINYAVDQASYIHSIIVEYEEGTPSTDPTITCANITDVPYQGVNNATATVTFNNATGWTPSISAFDGIVVTTASLSENTVTYSVSKNEGDTNREGSFTITLSKDDEEPVSKVVSVTQNHFVVDYATLPFSYDGNGSGELPSGLTQNGLGTYSSSPKMKFDDTGDYLILKINENPGTLTFKIKGNSLSGNYVFKLQVSTDGTNFTDKKSYTSISSTTTTETIADLDASVRYIKWIYTTKANGNVALGDINLAKEVAKYTVSIATGITNGSISVSPTSAIAGSTITITPNAAEGYILANYTICKTEDATDVTAIVNLNGNTFTMPAFDVTVSATFVVAEIHTVTIYDYIRHGSVTADKSRYAEGETVQLTATPEEGYALVEFNIWTEDYDDVDDIDINYNEETEYYEFTMPTFNIIVNASFAVIQTYTRITSINQLTPGYPYLIVGVEEDGTYYSMASQKTNNREAVVINATETTATVTPTDAVHEFFLSGDSTNHYTFYDKAVGSKGFLYAASSSSNHLKTQGTLDDNGKWSITFGENDEGEANIVALGNNTRNTMQYNSGSDLFSCYDEENNQSPVYLYKNDNPFPPEIFSNTTVEDLDITKGLIVNDYVRLEVTGGFIVDVNAPAPTEEEIQDIVEVGVTATPSVPLCLGHASQLVHNVGSPTGTIVKDIEHKYNLESGRADWNTIACPLGINMLGGLWIGSSQEIYSYDETTHFWIKNNETFVQAGLGQGFIYGVPEEETYIRVSMIGTLPPSNVDKSFALRYTEDLDALNGFNLVGNPFTCNAYVNMDYMVLNEEGSGFVNGGVIRPCDAILVQATGANQQITFSRDEFTQQNNRIDVSISQNRGNVIDNARIRFGEGRGMNKFYLNENSTRLYIPQNGKDYAVVMANAAEGELPVNFKAEKNGTYTITVNTENVEANYLHLIDNLTGMDTDLLSTPSYTFDAKTSDYASRFKLVFSMNDVESNQVEASNFAYISNGEIVISNEGRATLQVIDVMGRIISSEEINGEARISTNGLTAGLYILNLNGNVQKIVVR